MSINYISSAKETLELISESTNKSNLWAATHKYYFLYFCAYSILTALGIKSEIHECTIAIIEELEKNKVINFNLSEILNLSKKQRIENQYYLQNKTIHINNKELNSILISTARFIELLNQDTINKTKKIILENKSSS